MNQKSPEVAASSKQHITMSFEDAALNKDATVTEEVTLTLLIELEQQFGQIARHFHVYALVGPAWKREERDNSLRGHCQFKGEISLTVYIELGFAELQMCYKSPLSQAI